MRWILEHQELHKVHINPFRLKQMSRHLHAIWAFSVQQLLVGLGPTSISLFTDGTRKKAFVY